jgi:hypothetical protein
LYIRGEASGAAGCGMVQAHISYLILRSAVAKRQWCPGLKEPGRRFFLHVSHFLPTLGTTSFSCMLLLACSCAPVLASTPLNAVKNVGTSMYLIQDIPQLTPQGVEGAKIQVYAMPEIGELRVGERHTGITAPESQWKLDKVDGTPYTTIRNGLGFFMSAVSELQVSSSPLRSTAPACTRDGSSPKCMTHLLVTPTLLRTLVRESF